MTTIIQRTPASVRALCIVFIVGATLGLGLAGAILGLVVSVGLCYLTAADPPRQP